jgi:glycosyltransferase involved in cell wall biosynthesis
VQALVSRVPLQAAYSWLPAFAEQLARLVLERHFDVVHVEHLRGSRYGIALKSSIAAQIAAAQSKARTPVVWDSVDCISHLFGQAAQQSRSLQGRLLTRLELGRTRRYEGWLVHQFDQVVVTSPADRKALAVLARGAAEPGAAHTAVEEALQRKLHVVPNGVDLAYFRPQEARPEGAAIVLTGKMSYHANVTAAVHLVKEIMPQVWAQRPDAEVWIVGKDPAHAVQKLASRPGATQRRVVVTGTVPDLRPYLHKAAVAVAPIPYGAGIQNKVLEAMACGAPVVASSQAASALEAEPGRDLLVAGDSRTFAEAICGLLADPGHRHALGARGRAYVEQHHTWDQAVLRLEQVYLQAIENLESRV